MAQASLPRDNFLDETGQPSRAWRQWLLNPRTTSVNIDTAVPVTSGGTGLVIGTSGGILAFVNSTTMGSSAAIQQYGLIYGGGAGSVPGSVAPMTNGQLLVGVTNSAPVPTTISGDATLNASGALSLATANATPGAFGSAVAVATYTVNAKGLITASSTVPITGAQQMTVTTGFGCNSKAAQTSAASGGAVAVTGSTNAAPFGYTTGAQADAIVTLLNSIRAALVSNGIMS